MLLGFHLGFLDRHRLRGLPMLLALLAMLGSRMLRLWLSRLLARRLGVWNLLRWRVGCWLRWRRWTLLLRRVRLRRAASLVWLLWPRLRLRGDALSIVHARRLCGWARLRCSLTGLPSAISLLNLLCLVCLLRLLRLLGLLDGKELLLLLDILRLSMWHLLLKVHL